ncbi:hypothetical protein H2198_008166 [Neophaeococcomyces mojaviensis]|uniref:Uncharacterized protein n=1 Tax=Neophaeococcomyces mojaviensis TaxID=3383035 RepID=A0ACC2ZYN8_9EURO|nr:hypothetical protein H2198_008166 [Knufia sp. JES_112]
MSQPKKRDIADFFRPHAKIIPRKRPTPDPNEDIIIVDVGSQSQESSQQIPVTLRTVKNEATQVENPAHIHSRDRVLTTPKSGRSVSIPIRSPAAASPFKAVSAKRQALFGLSSRPPQTSPRSSNTSSFSFADIPSSNRNIVEDGKLVAVRDSDDDNESLESLTDILDRKKSDGPPTSSGVSEGATKQAEERVRMLSMYTAGRSNPIINKDSVRALQKRQQAAKFDIRFLVDEELADEEAEEKIRKADAEIAKSTEEMEQDRQKERDKNLLVAILQGNANQDPEDMARILNAVERTEAFTTGKSFSFFGRTGPKDTSNRRQMRTDFPKAGIPYSMWQHEDTTARDRAYLSGFMAEEAEAGRLTDDVLRWTFETSLQEQSEELQQVYFNCISAASPSWTRANVTPEDVNNIFIELGANPAALRDATEIKAQHQLKRESWRSNGRCLLAALHLMQMICQDMDFATLSKLTSTISRLSLDQEVMSNNRISQAVEVLLDKLTDLSDPDSRQHVHERLLSDLSVNLTDRTLQAQFLSHFIPTSPSAASLRTKLAMTFLLGSKAVQTPNNHTTKPPLVTLTNHISLSPAFSTTWHASSSTGPDYAVLTALVSILDIAVADGYPPASLFRLPDPSSSDARASRLDRKTEEAAFNGYVDDLADTVHSLFTSIADSGASHMRRTEAKDALQALHYRLLYGVRTKVRRKKHVFDPLGSAEGSDRKGRFRLLDEILQEAKGKDFMARFLKKTEKHVAVMNDDDDDEDDDDDIEGEADVDIPPVQRPTEELDGCIS